MGNIRLNEGLKQEGQCMYKVTVGRVRATILVVEKQ
jgi:hypothetical protein